MKHPTLGRTALRRLTVPPLAGGVELSSPPHRIADDRLSDAVNLWWQQGMLCTRPALRERGTLPGFADTMTATPLYRRTLLHGQNGTDHRFALVEEDGTLHGRKFVITGLENLLAVPAGRDIAEDDYCEAIVYLDADARGVYALTDTAALQPLPPYVPTVLSAARPTPDLVRTDSGAYTEPFNLLTDEFHCRFTSDGEGIYYWLPESVTLDHSRPVTVRHTDPVGTVITHTLDYCDTDGLWKERIDTVEEIPLDELALRYDPLRRCLWFVHAHGGGIAPAPQATVSGNVWLSATRADSGGRARIYGMRFGVWFGGSADGTAGGTRLFLSGNPAYPNLVQWSALGDPLYFPENNYAYVGDASGAVTAFGKQSDMLVIFKEREVYATQYRTGTAYTADELFDGTVTDTEAAAAVFPIQQIHPERGCDCPDTLRLCGDRLVWATSDGHVYTLLSSGAYDVRSVRALSFPIEAQLMRCRPDVLKAATAACVGDHYLLLVGDTAFALDCRSSGFSHYGSYASDKTAQQAVAWQAWGFDLPVTAQRLIRVRSTALLLTQVGDTLLTYGFDPDGACDRLPTADGSALCFTDRPIACELTTKRYELGRPAAYKQVCGVTLWVTGEAGAQVTVSLHDGTTARTLTTLSLSGDAPEATLPRYLPIHTPRMRQCGIRLQSTGRMAVDGIEVTFRGMGDIRA